MKKKILITAMALLLLLTGISPAAITLTTAVGAGADGGISNDGNQGPNVLLGTGTTANLRTYDGTRAKAVTLRFDVRGVGGDMSGATLSFTTTSANRARTLNIWKLMDDTLDTWDEATLCYNTAPGLIHEGEEGYRLAYLDMVYGKWTVMNTMPISTTAGLNTGAIDPNYIAQDKNGLVTLLLYLTAVDNNATYYISMKEGGVNLPTLTFPNARCAINPVPAAGASVLPSLSTLSWTNTEPNLPEGAITCNVYFGANEPNLAEPGYNLTQIASGTASTSVAIPSGMLPLAEGTYYWVVDSFDSSTSPNFLGTGADWSFTVTSVPLIVTHPTPQTVALGETAEFSVTTESYSTPTYTWYRSADNANNTSADDTQVGTDSATLSFVTVGNDEGYYYCKVVNASGEANAARSNTAALVVERQVAHWTLDQADLVGNQYLDVSGNGHHANPNTAVPSFVAGVTAGSDAVSMDPNSFASAGTWNPAYVSGQLTISAWINWEGENGSYQDVLSKIDTYSEPNMMWQFGVSQGGNVSLLADHGNNDDAILNGQAVIGAWDFIAVTFDGTTATVYRALNGDLYFTTVSEAYAFGTNLQAAIGLGARVDGTSTFNGAIDDIQVFNYAKDPVGIADLYNEMLSRDFCVLQYGSTQYDLDANNNCRIELADYADLAAQWMLCGFYPAAGCP